MEFSKFLLGKFFFVKSQKILFPIQDVSKLENLTTSEPPQFEVPQRSQQVS